MPEARITKDDIQAKAEQIRQQVDQGTRAAAPAGLAVAGAIVVVAVGVAYLLGRRRGRRNKTVVEVRRV